MRWPAVAFCLLLVAGCDGNPSGNGFGSPQFTRAVGQFATAYVAASSQIAAGRAAQPYQGGYSNGGGYGGNASCEECVVSDLRLKRLVMPVGKTAEGLTLYRFAYRKGAGPEGEFVGVMAQDLLGGAQAGAVHIGADGFFRVDYAALGLRLLTYREWAEARG